MRGAWSDCFSFGFECFQVFLADTVVPAQLDGSEFPLANPVPDRDDLDPIPFGNLVAGVQFRHVLPPFFVYFDGCVWLGFVIL